MERIAHSFHPLNADVARQQLVQFIGKLLAVDFRIRVEMGHHHPCMHTGIGAPGTRGVYLCTQQQRQAPVQFALHRNAVGLHLPAMKSCPVVA